MATLADQCLEAMLEKANEADVFYMFSAQAFIMGLFNKYLSLSC
jgi:hypothetical protein